MNFLFVVYIKVRLHTTSTFQSKNESVPGMYVCVWYPTRSFSFSLSVTLMIIAKMHNETNSLRLREDGGREKIKEEVCERDTMLQYRCVVRTGSTVIPLLLWCTHHHTCNIPTTHA